jgi:hypothetical protein
MLRDFTTTSKHAGGATPDFAKYSHPAGCETSFHSREDCFPFGPDPDTIPRDAGNWPFSRLPTVTFEAIIPPMIRYRGPVAFHD